MVVQAGCVTFQVCYTYFIVVVFVITYILILNIFKIVIVSIYYIFLFISIELGKNN